MKLSREFWVVMIILSAAGILLHTVSREEGGQLPQNLADFPLRIEQWSGKAVWYTPEILRVLKADDYMMREYRDGKEPPIGLFVGYYKHIRQGAAYHSPKNCLPGSGWYFVKTGRTHIDVSDRHRQSMEINAVVVQKDLDKHLILYWYQDRGRIIASEYWAKVYLVLDAITRNRTDGALVRVTVPFVGDDAQETVLMRGMAFVEKMFPLLQEYLPS